MIPQTEKHKFGAVSLNQTLKEKVTSVTSAPVVQFVENTVAWWSIKNQFSAVTHLVIQYRN